MLWDSSRNAGFTDGTPWLRLDRSWHRENVKTQEQDLYSSFALYRRLIRLRQEEPSLKTGAYSPVCSDTQLIAYIRKADDHPAFLIVLNLTHRPCYFAPASLRFKGIIVLDTFPELEQSPVENTVDLSGDEGLIVRLEEWAMTSTPSTGAPSPPVSSPQS
jgi:alpha-glucosidase